jgi:hypothetical protein
MFALLPLYDTALGAREVTLVGPPDTTLMDPLALMLAALALSPL